MSQKLDDNLTREYFFDHANDWVRDGYDPENARVYPTPFHRARVVCRILENKSGAQKIADIGCGGGNLAIMLAERGHQVTACDRSQKMLDIANASVSNKKADVRERLEFVCADINEDMNLDKAAYDSLLAMGVIGYLPSDNVLFEIAKKALKPGGMFLVSCRNRLFNMVSFSDRTRKEIETGEALSLLEEIDRLYHPVSPNDALNLLQKIENNSRSASRLEFDHEELPQKDKDAQVDGNMAFEPRQQTPESMALTASHHGFEVVSQTGIHPHLIDPRMNRLLPSGVFNRLTEAAEVFESLPIGLIWSSVFIGAYRLQ